MSYIPTALQSWNVGGIQAGLAAVYESRVHTISKMTVARGQYAGDTAVTMTDGSYNIRTATTPSAVPVSATAVLANSTNTYSAALAAPKNSWGKPVVVKVKRDEQSSEILAYGVFNADGTIPGSDGTTAQDDALDPWNLKAGSKSRYKVNPATGEIYVNNASLLIELKNPDGVVNFQVAGYNDNTSVTYNGITGASNTVQQGIAPADVANLEGQDKVVGMVEFEGLQGGALSLAQQQAAELSAVIQSLTSTLRATNDSKKSILSLIR